MLINVNDKVLLTTNAWFYAPDGQQYKAVWGTLHGIHSDADTLGIKTNARSTNWYLNVGDMIVAGCQVFYAIKCPVMPPKRIDQEITSDALEVKSLNRPTDIYNADASFCKETF